MSKIALQKSNWLSLFNPRKCGRDPRKYTQGSQAMLPLDSFFPLIQHIIRS